MTTRLTSKFDALRVLAGSRKLRKRDYRHSMVDAEVRHGLCDQIRAMRERAGWSQSDLAKKIGTSQPNVARMEAARDKYLSFQTLLAVARAFDVALLVRFVPFSEIVRRSFDTSEYEQAPLSFDEEVGFTSRSVVATVQPKASKFAPAPQLTRLTERLTSEATAPTRFVDAVA